MGPKGECKSGVSNEKCMGSKCDGVQCSRRRMKNEIYCGSHIKNVLSKDLDVLKVEKKEVWSKEIQGIVYYIDNLNEIYNAEDILLNKTHINPIGKYENTKENPEIIFYKT